MLAKTYDENRDYISGRAWTAIYYISLLTAGPESPFHLEDHESYSELVSPIGHLV